jgi:hypothetical protein
MLLKEYETTMDGIMAKFRSFAVRDVEDAETWTRYSTAWAGSC